MPVITLLAPILLVILPGTLLGPSLAFAHGGSHEGVDHGAIGWTTDPFIVVPIAISAFAFARGSIRIHGRRQSRLGRRRLVRRMVAYAAGWLTLALALLSPLHALGERLFTAHMIEHEILMAVSAPLLVLSRPLAMLLFALPDTGRLAMARLWSSSAGGRSRAALKSGGLATVVHGAVLWLWHVPQIFDAAVIHDGLHRLQHLSFFASALWFWWAVLWASTRSAATWHLFVTMMHMSVLGALMALSPRVLYTVQTSVAGHYGLTPLEDQQLAGLLMWVPAGTIYAGAAMTMAALAIAQSSRRHSDGRRVRPA